MLKWIELLARRPGPPAVLVGGVGALLAAQGAGALLALAWALPAWFTLEVLRQSRAWLYLVMGRDDLALAAARALLAEAAAEGDTRGSGHRLAAGAALLRLRRTPEAKEVLGPVDPARLGEGSRPGYFLLMGALYVRLGDAPGARAMTEAGRVLVEDDPRAAGTLAVVENLTAVAALLEGDLEDAAARLEALDLGAAGPETRAVVWNNRAWVELRRGGDARRALAWARRAARARPGEAIFRGTLGAALLEAGGDPAEAQAHLARALEVAGDVAPQERIHLQDYAARAQRALGGRRETRQLAGGNHDGPGAAGGGRPRALPARGSTAR